MSGKADIVAMTTGEDPLQDGLDILDALYLRKPLLAAASRLFPVPAFFFLVAPGAGETVKHLPENFPSDIEKTLLGLRPGAPPLVSHGILCIPLKARDNKVLVLLVHGVDPALLGRMAPDWLGKLQGELQDLLEQIRMIYIDPATGSYSLRALQSCLEEPVFLQAGKTLFLLALSAGQKTVLQNSRYYRQLAASLAEVLPRPLFVLDQGLLGFFRETGTVTEQNGFSRRFLRWLRREGIRRAHIAFAASNDLERGGKAVLDLCLRALENMETRGPFGLSNAGYPEEFPAPTGPPLPADLLRQLQSSWRGESRFVLVLLQSAAPHQILLEHIASGSALIPQALPWGQEFCLVLPGYSGAEARQWVTDLNARLLQSGQPAVTAGCGAWPMPGYRKHAMPGCSRKALCHALLLGPGEVAVFDHISCNVSGDIFFDQGDYRSAARDYRAGLRVSPGDVNLLNSLGVTLVELGQLGRALALFEEALQQAPTDQMALTNAGFCCQDLGRPAPALDYLERAVACSAPPEGTASLELIMQLATLYVQAGEFVKAVVVLEDRLQKERSQPEGRIDFALQRLLAEALLEDGKLAEAILVVEDGLRQRPNDRECLSMLGHLYGRSGQGEELGLSLCQRALADGGESVFCWYHQACLMYALARYTQAESSCMQGLARDPGFAPMQLLLAEILRKTGRGKKALTYYKRVCANKKATGSHKKTAEKRLQEASRHQISAKGRENHGAD